MVLGPSALPTVNGHYGGQELTCASLIVGFLCSVSKLAGRLGVAGKWPHVLFHEKEHRQGLGNLDRRASAHGKPFDGVFLEITGLANLAPIAFMFFTNPFG